MHMSQKHSYDDARAMKLTYLKRSVGCEIYLGYGKAHQVLEGIHMIEQEYTEFPVKQTTMTLENIFVYPGHPTQVFGIGGTTEHGKALSPLWYFRFLSFVEDGRIEIMYQELRYLRKKSGISIDLADGILGVPLAEGFDRIRPQTQPVSMIEALGCTYDDERHLITGDLERITQNYTTLW
jgi:hypothetical protein